MRRVSHLSRALRSLTALLTVWCLGCSGYDPLLAAVIPGSGGSMMDCASERAASITSTESDGSQTRAVIASSDASGQDGATCGCESCYAPAAAMFAVVSVPTTLPHQPSADASAPPSVDRTPLVPPPQRAA